MLIKFLPSQVAKHWEEIKDAIKIASPLLEGESEEKYNNVLEMILIGKMDCWISTGDDGKVDGVITTMIIDDPLAGNRELLLYTLTSIGNSGIDSWKTGLDTLKTFSRGAGCSRIIAYSNNSLICRYVESIGGSCDYKVVIIPLG